MNGIVYRFNPETKVFIGEYQCQMSPLEPGVYLDDIPNSLKEPPPMCGEKEVVCAVDGAWVVMQDIRGIWYSITGEIISVIEVVDPFTEIQPNWQREMPEAPVVPDQPISVSPWQFRRALNQLGLRSQVEAAVANSNDQDIKDGWEFASVFIRTDPLVVGMAQALGKTESEMDALFELAKTL